MKIDAKKIYGKMVDYRTFAIVLLVIGVFLYLGMIIPKESATTIQQLTSALGSIVFLVSSIFFFEQSKKQRKRLEECEEGQKYLLRK